MCRGKMVMPRTFTALAAAEVGGHLVIIITIIITMTIVIIVIMTIMMIRLGVKAC